MKNNKVTLTMATTLSIGAIIGSGIFVFTGYGIGYAGPAIPIAFLLAAFLTVFMTLPSIQLGSAIPANGGSYNYTSRFTHPFFGFIQILNSFIGALNLAVMSLAFAAYFTALWPGANVTIIAAITLLVFAGIGTFGIRMSGRVQTIIVYILIAALALYVITGINDLSSAYITFGKMLKPLGGFAGLWSAIAIVRYTLQGGTISLTFAEEMENPGRDVPLSFFIGTVITAIIYAVVAYIAVGTAPYEAIAWQPLSVSAGLIMKDPWFTMFIIGGGMIATFTTLNGSIIIYSRIHWAAARDGIWPEIFTKQNKHGVPVYTLWTCVAAALVVILFQIELGRIFYLVAVPALLLGPIYMIPGALLPFKLPKCHQSAYFHMNKWVTVAIAAISAGLSLWLGWSLFGRMQQSDYIGMLVFFGIGIIYWFIRVWWLKKYADTDLVAKIGGYHQAWVEKEESL